MSWNTVTRYKALSLSPDYLRFYSLEILIENPYKYCQINHSRLSSSVTRSRSVLTSCWSWAVSCRSWAICWAVPCRSCVISSWSSSNCCILSRVSFASFLLWTQNWLVLQPGCKPQERLTLPVRPGSLCIYRWDYCSCNSHKSAEPRHT